MGRYCGRCNGNLIIEKDHEHFHCNKCNHEIYPSEEDHLQCDDVCCECIHAFMASDNVIFMYWDYISSRRG